MTDAKAIFLAENGDLRSGWRVVCFLLLYTFGTSILGIIFVLAGGMSLQGTPLFFILSGLISLIPAVVVGAYLGKILETLPLSAIVAARSGGWIRSFASGSIWGTLTLSLAVLVVFVGGGESFRFNSDVEIRAVIESLLISFAVFAVAAAAEEALFRGYVMQTLSRSGYAWLAIALTSIPFSIAHLNNPNTGIMPTINTVLAGVWFGVAYLKTRDLWFVWGLHLMWNFVQGSVFGIEVSGLTELSTAPILREIDNGPTWLTGTTYGIEGGIACTIAILVSIIAIAWVPKDNSTADEHK